MSADLTRDDLARLVSQLRDIDSDTMTVERENRAYHDLRNGLCDHADALLALAIEALDRRDGLVFGPKQGPNEDRYAVAADGLLYMVHRYDTYLSRSGRYGVWTSDPDFGGGPMPSSGVTGATESEAIEKAREHDKARRGGK